MSPVPRPASPPASPNPLGDFLRSRRERLRPQDLGLPARRRRTPGLRREEVAALAGIGIDWYVRLEQGRCVKPSTTTIDALASALRLDDTEHDHLRALVDTAARGAFVRETVPDELRALVDDLRQPAYVVGRRWDVLAWNRAADRLFGFAAVADDDRNILVHVLINPAARRLFGAAWADQARFVVAQFRVSHDLWAGDPAFESLLRRLRAECREFAGWWKGHDVRRPRTGLKILRHPKQGEIRLAHASFQSTDDPNLRLVIYREV